MEFWVIAAAIATMGLVLVVSITIAAAALMFLWRRFTEGVMRGFGLAYMPMRQDSPQERASARLGEVMIPLRQESAAPRPRTVSRLAGDHKPARPRLVPQAVDEDRTKTVAFSRYNAEDDQDTESDEGGPRSWKADANDGRSNISLEGDITPRPAAGRKVLPFTPPTNSFHDLFRRK